ncbi:hypothetical protein L2E82_19889 [Cichorium intybus]|uniref:Uncharacterized protein n=1 Tax=Cichorium intybus TaxID=13427 RepID=A0ACB9DRV2_CICIN|nr:hypothetical protein L2E82_19889 [Cichorium intybus]
MACSPGQILHSISIFSIRPVKFAYENENVIVVFPSNELVSHQQLDHMKCLVSSRICDSNVLSAYVLSDYGLFQRLFLYRRKIPQSNEHLELKFRIYDGTNIGHNNYASSTTVTALKQKLVSEWPQGKYVVPKTVNDIKLIHLGKVLENNKTLLESGVCDGAFACGLIIMHVVIQPVLIKNKSAKKQDETGKLNSCGCIILYIFVS